MTLEHKEGERNQGFSIRVEKPESIYRYLLSQLPFLEYFENVDFSQVTDIKDVPSTSIDENLSNTNLDGRLFMYESTVISESREDSLSGGVNWGIHTLLVFSDSLTVGQKFYSTERVKNIRNILEAKGLSVSHFESKYRNTLLVFNDNENVEISIAFGNKDISSMVREKLEMEVESSEDRNKIWNRLPSILQGNIEKGDIEKMKRAFSNATLNLKLQEHDITLDLCGKNEKGRFILLDLPKDEKSFAEYMQFYAKTYEEVMKALCEEAGQNLPQNPIVLKSSHNISTILRLD